jgi:hypothetical protein
MSTALDGADATTFVVVGTMGAGDEAALAAAASSDAPYVSLVASRKKARYLIDYVRAEGVPAERLERVKFPAGLDLGGMSASEIALSVLAEIVQRRYAKPDVNASAAAVPANPTPLARHRTAGCDTDHGARPHLRDARRYDDRPIHDRRGRPHHLLLLPRLPGHLPASSGGVHDVKEPIARLQQAMAKQGYITDRATATAAYLAMTLHKPLLVEGPPGVGKTEIAKVLAGVLDTELVRLQCYEGLDVSTALYECNYPKQLLHIKLGEGSGRTVGEREAQSLSEAFLLERPLLRASRATRQTVLLIDEVDRSDEEFEAFLLEVLSSTRSRSGNRHGPRDVRAVRHPDLEPHRELGGAPSSLSLSLDRLSVAREGDRNRSREGASCPHGTRGVARGIRPGDSTAASSEARCRRDARLANALVASAPKRSMTQRRRRR